MATSTKATRHLGAYLRELRTSRKMSTVDVGAHLDQSDSTVSRYERGDLRLQWAVIDNLVRLYDGNEEELAEARRRYEATKDEPKPVRLPAKTPRAFRRLVNEERVAKSVELVQPIVIPGLLQTEEYTQALFDVGNQFHDPRSRSDGAISVRLARQQRLALDDPRPLQLHAVVDEIVIRRRVGGVDVMRRQLLHLIAMCGQWNVELQVVKAEAGAYGVSTGGCSIFKYADGDSVPGVYFEYPAGSAWVEDTKDVQRFTNMFNSAVRVALSPDDTMEYLHQQVRALEGK
jgi:transcriptional regulator with XRE-family HTH domain